MSYNELDSDTNKLFLTPDNEFLGIIYSLLRGWQNIFLAIFNAKFVLKCAKTFWKSVDKNKCYVQKYFWIGNFLQKNGQEGK